MPKHLHAAHPMPALRQPDTLRALVVALCLSAGLSACNGESDMPLGSAAASTPAVAAAQTHSTADKLHTYVACFNQLDAAARRSIARYQSWVTDMSQGPSGQETVVHGLYSMNVDGIAQCRDDFNAALRTKPGVPALEEAAVRYGDALKELGALVTEANVYYSRDNYKDDAFSKGKIMHVLLADAMQTFITSSQNFSDAIGVENDKARSTGLAAIDPTGTRVQHTGKQAPTVPPYSGLMTASHKPDH